MFCIHSSAIIWSCILNIFNPECVIGLFIKQNNPKHYSWTQRVIFLHEVCSTGIQDKMLYLIINLDYGT